jgi:photosystem II stability/assembly factor-like uncharacterized protein
MIKNILLIVAMLPLMLVSCTTHTNKKKTQELRQQHAYYLENSPFSKTKELSKAQRKALGIPPNKYLERQWELTINPKTGRPTPEKLFALQKQLHQQRENTRTVPGQMSNPWIERGPGNVGGRTKAVMFDPADPTHKRVFAGGVSGGLWVNDDISNANSEWQLTSLPHNLAVSSITFDPNNPQNMFVGTGESYTSGQATGNGIWRSTDGGQTWSNVFGGQTAEAQFVSNATMSITSPAGMQGDFPAVIAAFGNTNFNNYTGNLVLVDDGSANPTLACNALVNGTAISGNIAVIERGDCFFVDKIKNAQNAGAIGVLMINNVGGTPIVMGGDDATITIPSVMITKADGQAILTALSNNTSINVNIVNNHTEVSMGYIVPGITHINDIVTRNNNGVTEIYASAGDAYYGDASLFTVMGEGYQGVYKSVDNGATWQKLNMPLDPDGKVYVPFDLEVAADNKIWLTTTRSTINGTANGAVLSSADGTNFSVVLPATNVGRMELAVSKTDPGKMYLIVVQYSGSSGTPIILKTTDGFSANISSINNPSDSDIGGSDFTNGQSFYDLFIDVDPNNDEVVYVGGIDIFKSTNGGSNWTQISSYYGNTSSNIIHPDQHGIAFADSQHILFGNDGGVAYTSNAGATIVHRNNKYNVTQFYHMAVAPTTAFSGDYFMAGAQDNGTQLFENAPQQVANSTEAQGGDGAYCFFDQDGTDRYRISNYVYNNNIRLYDYTTQYWKTVNYETTEHGDFINQEALDSNLNILYSNYSTSSTNGNSYVIRRYSNLLGSISKYNITDNLLNSFPTALTVSPFTTNSSKLFVGLQNGKLLKVNNANSSPQFVDITGDEFVGSISDIAFGQTENDILVTIFNYGVESIFYTSDGGQTWVSKEGNLPDMPVNTILQNPLNTNEVIVGTDLGVWATPNFNDPNPSWYQSYNGMSDVKVTDLELRDDNTAFASTFGRGVFSGTFDSAASITSNSNIVNVKAYPNPAVNLIQVEFPVTLNTIAHVYDINGREVLKRELINDNHLQLNVSHLPKGNYFVSLKNGKTKYLAKFIKH